MNSEQKEKDIPQSLVLLLAAAVGVTAANLYYAQPIIAMISKAVGLQPAAAGLVVTLTQVGYGLGVLFLVPLGDILENRKLVLTMMGVTFFGLLGLTFATHLIPYFIAAFVTGLGASAVQVMVPYAAHLAPEKKRGQIIGTLMSGLMIGIMLSRPISSLLTDWFSWHSVFLTSAAMMVILAGVLYKYLPPRAPSDSSIRYSHLIKSMMQIVVDTPVLRRRAIYQAFLFGAFCLFWTASPLLLSGEKFNFSQTTIAIFALVGVAGAISAPFAGKAADRGWSQRATIVAMLASSFSFLLSHFFPMGSTASVVALVVSAILLDAGITANLVLGQRAIFSLQPELRSRLNGLYVAIIFIGGASGSALGGWAYANGGWELTSMVGFALPAMALLYFATEFWHK